MLEPELVLGSGLRLVERRTCSSLEQLGLGGSRRLEVDESSTVAAKMSVCGRGSV